MTAAKEFCRVWYEHRTPHMKDGENQELFRNDISINLFVRQVPSHLDV